MFREMLMRLSSVARRALPGALAILLVTLATGLACEGLYRIYLAQMVKAQIADKFKPAPLASFRAYGAEPWLFDERQGFVFNQKPWVEFVVKDSAVSRCSTEAKANKYGNFGRLDQGYEDADLKLMIVGSSYSMVSTAVGPANPQDLVVADYLAGELVNEVLARQLSRRLGKRVHVLNYSRDATGVLSYVDIARTKVVEHKPQVILSLINTPALIYRRHWRQVLPDGAGGRRLYFMLSPHAKPLDADLAYPQQEVVNDAITPEWCAKMEAAKLRNDEAALRSDPLVRTLIAQNERRQREFVTPRQTVDFWRRDVSFIYNVVTRRNPFHAIKLFEDQPVYAPLALDRYSDDPEFVAAVADLKRSGVPVIPIQIPTLPEMLKLPKGGFAFAEHGVPSEQGNSLAADLEQQLGERWVHLYSFYPAGLKDAPLKLVHSDKDSHPSPLGVRAMADALERVLREHPRTAPLLGLTPSSAESSTVPGLGAPVTRPTPPAVAAGLEAAPLVPGDGRNRIPSSESLGTFLQSGSIAEVRRAWFTLFGARQYRIAAAGAPGEHYASSRPLPLESGPYTWSLEAKPEGIGKLRLQAIDEKGAGLIADFDFEKLSSTTTRVGGAQVRNLRASIQKSSRGWYRVSFGAEVAAGDGRLIVQLSDVNGARGFTPNGESVLVRGLQLERGQSASPYRPTSEKRK